MASGGVSARLARLDLGFRAERRRTFGPIVLPVDGWDIILLLYLADSDGLRRTARDVLEELGDGIEAGRRRIAHLSRAGLIVGGGAGSLDDVVTLAPEAIKQVGGMIERAWTQIDAI